MVVEVTSSFKVPYNIISLEKSVWEGSSNQSKQMVWSNIKKK